jgi:hypothetical protein
MFQFLISENLARAVKTVVPVSSSSSISAGNGGGVTNFKISRLNDALQAINPRYQPIGFSITSVESCSPSVLQDAISAAETGVYTLLSVIGKLQSNLVIRNVLIRNKLVFRNFLRITNPFIP